MTAGAAAVTSRSMPSPRFSGEEMKSDLWFSYTLTIPGKVEVKKNGKRILRNKSTGRSFIASSSAYKQWERDAVGVLRAAWGDREPLPAKPMNAKMTFYLPTKTRADQSNLYQGPEDALEKADIITNDYWIRGHDGSRQIKTNDEPPRVVITLTPLDRGME